MNAIARFSDKFAVARQIKSERHCQNWSNRFRMLTACMLCVLTVSIWTEVSHAQPVVWTGANNGDGPFTGVIPGNPPSTFSYYFPITNRWDASEVIDEFGNLLAPGNWTTSHYPSTGVSVLIPAPVGSYPPRLNVAVSDLDITVANEATMQLNGGTIHNL